MPANPSPPTHLRLGASTPPSVQGSSEKKRRLGEESALDANPETEPEQQRVKQATPANASDKVVVHERNSDNEANPGPGTSPEQQRVQMEVHPSTPAPPEPLKSNTQCSKVQEPSESTSPFDAPGTSTSVTLQITSEATQHPPYISEILNGERRPGSYMEAQEAHSADAAAFHAGQIALAARDNIAAQSNHHTTHTVTYVPHLVG